MDGSLIYKHHQADAW